LGRQKDLGQKNLGRQEGKKMAEARKQKTGSVVLGL
jgi:hypothetical protein